MLFINEYENYVILEDFLYSLGHSNDLKVYGICFWDKYCWTNVFGFEILKDEE